MKRSTFLILLALLSIGGAWAQTINPNSGGTIETLLPSGVVANISTDQGKTKDLNLVVTGSKEKGYKAFFAATRAAEGQELWVTDGTPGGTHLVKDIYPGATGSDIRWLARFNDKVVFAATGVDEAQFSCGSEVWISDGTEEGTYQVTQIHTEYGNANPRGFMQINENQFIFIAKSKESELVPSGTGPDDPQYWLYVSDASSHPVYDDEANVLEIGARLIKECDARWPGAGYSYHSPWARVGRKVFFKADTKDKTVGEELWVTDGTEEGTYLVKDINPRTNESSGIDQMINLDNKMLYFSAYTFEYGAEPWASDGTAEGTYMIYDTNPNKNSSTGEGLGGFTSEAGQYPYKGKVYSRGYLHPEGTSQLGSTNGEKDNYKALKVNPANTTGNFMNSYPDPGVEFDGHFLFCAQTGEVSSTPNNFGGELCYTDGDTVFIQSNFVSGTGANWVKELTVVAGTAYWWIDNGTNAYNRKLHRLNYLTGSTGATPVRVHQWVSNGADNVMTLRSLGDTLLLFGRGTSPASISLYSYYYRKPEYDPELHADKHLDPDFGECPRLEAGFSKTENPTCDNNDGELEITIAGGTGTYSILWSNGSTVESAGNNLPAGVYTVTVTDGCTVEPVELTFTLAAPSPTECNTSIEQISTTKAVIYPNPTTNTFNINVEGEVLKVMIFDIMGRLVKTELQPASKSVDVSSLQKGVYNVLITSINQNYQSTLIVE